MPHTSNSNCHESVPLSLCICPCVYPHILYSFFLLIKHFVSLFYIFMGILPFPSPEDLPNPGVKPRSPTLQADSLSAEPQEKLKNTGVGSLYHLQQIFLTQESNQGILLCRQYFYQLSCQGSQTLDIHTLIPGMSEFVIYMSKRTLYT